MKGTLCVLYAVPSMRSFFSDSKSESKAKAPNEAKAVPGAQSVQPSSLRDRISSMKVDWTKDSTWPKEQFDFIIGTDLIATRTMVRPLQVTIHLFAFEMNLAA